MRQHTQHNERKNKHEVYEVKDKFIDPLVVQGIYINYPCQS